MSVIDTKVMTEFSGDLNSFNNAMSGAKTDVEKLLRTPGIESERINEEILNLKNELDKISAKWNELSEKFQKELNISIESADRFKEAIDKTLQTY